MLGQLKPSLMVIHTSGPDPGPGSNRRYHVRILDLRNLQDVEYLELHLRYSIILFTLRQPSINHVCHQTQHHELDLASFAASSFAATLENSTRLQEEICE